mgnify:CR=1 FL=1
MTTQKKTTIGGQAIIEGIVMKGPKKSCTVVRKANGELVSKTEPTPSRAPIWEKPIFRGAYTLFTAMKEACRPSTTPRPSLRTRKPMCRRPDLNSGWKRNSVRRV